TRHVERAVQWDSGETPDFDGLTPHLEPSGQRPTGLVPVSSSSARQRNNSGTPDPIITQDSQPRLPPAASQSAPPSPPTLPRCAADSSAPATPSPSPRPAAGAPAPRVAPPPPPAAPTTASPADH
ncbi:hypothetical protein LTR53_017963, partial [Teratosphaeriaceae sp. CCFEE 6253]